MPFGGIFSVIREFSLIERLIDSELGRRLKDAGSQYGEIMRTMMCYYLCGGDRMEDIKIYQPGIEYLPGPMPAYNLLKDIFLRDIRSYRRRQGMPDYSQNCVNLRSGFACSSLQKHRYSFW
ncbi:MAG: hypothetical protein NC097_01250 [Clostridium sp.]|nr:hypothetical protein [Clostridium sp.]